MPSGKDMRPVETVTSVYPMLEAVQFRRCIYMTGMKKAVQMGNGPIVVSPAMYELIMKAESQHELRQVLVNIPLLRLPAFDPYAGAWEMTAHG